MHRHASERSIAAGLVTEITYCGDCNVLHLHLGAVTLRLQPAAAHDLRDTLTRALVTLPFSRADATATHPIPPSRDRNH